MAKATPSGHRMLVSCLMLTTPARFAFAKRAIAGFCRQTYESRELVVLSRAHSVADRRCITSYVDSLARRDIRIVFISNDLTVGAARNRSVAEARGRFVCTWDDDDLHHPARIADQVAALRASGRQACYLGDVFQHIEADAAIYWTHWANADGGAHPGTLLADTRSPIVYPDVDLNEDTAVLQAFMRAGQAHVLGQRPQLFVYVSHGENLSSDEHHRTLARLLGLPRTILTSQEAAIRSALSAFDFPLNVDVRGPDGPAFMLHPQASPRQVDQFAGLETPDAPAYGSENAQGSDQRKPDLPAGEADILVSCLMLTTPSRFDFAKRAIAAYCRQSHASRELVVLSRAIDPADQRRILSYVDSLGRRDIRVAFVSDDLTTGAARNRGIAEARGGFICTWDDDDLHHPARVAEQMAALRASGRRACFLGDVFQFLESDAAIYWTDWAQTAGGAHPGTLLASKTAAVIYPDTRTGSDTVVLQTLTDAGDVHVLVRRPQLFIYVSHGQNLWSGDHHRMLVRRLGLPGAALISQAAEIRSALSSFDFPSNVTVSGADGVAFRLRESAAASNAIAFEKPPSTVEGRRQAHSGESRPTVLLAQEFGGNFGHVARLVAIARSLGPARLVFAVSPGPGGRPQDRRHPGSRGRGDRRGGVQQPGRGHVPLESRPDACGCLLPSGLRPSELA